ncbi:efflux RND transporter periplasmic adaptor subunit [bacterium]|nr:efflux RND transporter periplasmic adaptor subunit [bacterium]
MKKALIIVSAIILLPILFRLISKGLFNLTYKPVFIPPKVKVETIKEKEIYQSFEASGRVDSVSEVNIVARVSGYLLKSYFKEGAFVKAGQTLFLIEPAQYQNSVSTSNADIKNIQAKLNYANKQLARARELVKQDYIAKSKYDEIQSQRDSLVAQLSAANSQHRDAMRNLSYTSIKAPVSGRVGSVDVSAGNYVSPSSSPLTTIYSTNPIYVLFSLSAEKFNALTKIDKTPINHRVEIFLPDGTKYNYTGIQDFYDNKVDKSTGSIKLRATFQNPENLLIHGEFVKVRIYANKPIIKPIVPIVAVMSSQESKYVYKLDKNNIPQMSYIQIGAPYDSKHWIVKSGLKVGDRIVTDGVLKVIPQKPVEIEK